MAGKFETDCTMLSKNKCECNYSMRLIIIKHTTHVFRRQEKLHKKCTYEGPGDLPNEVLRGKIGKNGEGKLYG